MTEIFTDSQGNTYELGATFDPNTVLNPGITGSVTHTMTNLISGTTYEFIVVSYNNLGYSGYAGPLTVFILPRPEILAFACSWPNQWVWSGNYWTRSEKTWQRSVKI